MKKPLLTYSDVVSAGLILPRKSKYTVRDCKAVQVNSLFHGVRTLTDKEARFIVKCSAAFHDTDRSRAVGEYGADKSMFKA